MFGLLELKVLFKLLHNHIDWLELIQRLNFKMNYFNSRNKSI
jgi:hypothetical protein